jgi:hypothetical protein
MDPHSFSKLDPDPDPHSPLKLDPDLHSPLKLDPDPHKDNADPKHCGRVSFRIPDLTCLICGRIPD